LLNKYSLSRFAVDTFAFSLVICAPRPRSRGTRRVIAHCLPRGARSLQEDWMKTFALALAAALALGLSSPSFVGDAAAAQGLKMAQADVSVKVGGPRRTVKKVIVRRDRGLHRGWRHSRHYGATKKVIIKRTGDRVVKKKVIIR
jgi:hypothetical protein